MNSKPPSISSVSDLDARPLISVMMPAYKDARFIGQALESILTQDLGADRMHIEVVDDGSPSNDIRHEVERVGKGRVHYWRQPENVGAIRNFNTCLQRSRGHYVHFLHADDMVSPNFYETLMQPLERQSFLGAAFCGFSIVDESGRCSWESEILSSTPGILRNLLDLNGIYNHLQMHCVIVRRKVYERLGGFRIELPHTADWEFWSRMAAHCSVWYEPEILAHYRQYEGNDTSRLVKTGENVRDIRRAMTLIHAMLPVEKRETISRQAHRWQALKAMATAHDLRRKGEYRAAFNQMKEALRTSRDWKVLKALVQNQS